MKYNPINRRMFLQGVSGGCALAIPFLPSFARFAHAQANNSPPLRLAMMFGNFGRDMAEWYPNLPDNALMSAPGALYKPLSQIAKPLSYCLNSNFDPVLNKISILRGLDCMSTDGMHNASVPTTGSSISPSSNAGFGYAIDCVLEESGIFYTTQPRLSALRTCPSPERSFSDFSNYSYSSKIKRGQMVRNVQWNPQTVFNSYLDAASSAKIAAKNGRIQSGVDAVLDDFNQAMRGRELSSEDKQRLDGYVTYIADLRRELNVPIVGCGFASPPGAPTVYSELHKAMIKMEVAALACGTTKIVMHSITQNGDAPYPGLSWHENVHATTLDDDTSARNSATGRTWSAEYCKYRMGLVAYFLTELDKIQESNGTLLDNTLFIYGNEDSTGAHEHVDLPVLIAGAKGKFKNGYFVDFRPRPLYPLVKPRIHQMLYAGRPYNGLLVSALKAFGIPANEYEKFGQIGFGRSDSPFGKVNTPYVPFLGSKLTEPLPFIYG